MLLHDPTLQTHLAYDQVKFSAPYKIGLSIDRRSGYGCDRAAAFGQFEFNRISSENLNA